MKLPAYDLYAVLGVRPDADLDTIRRAHRACVRHAHPDRRPEVDAARAHEDMVRISMAWAVLIDPRTRAECDASSPPPPQPRPRLVMCQPQQVDFGEVPIGQTPADQLVLFHFDDFSTIRSWRLLDEGGVCWVAEPVPQPQLQTRLTVRLRGRPVPSDAPTRVWDQLLRIQLDEVTASLRVTATITAAPMSMRLGRLIVVLAAVLSVILGVVIARGAGEPPWSDSEQPRSRAAAEAPERLSAPANGPGTVVWRVPGVADLPPTPVSSVPPVALTDDTLYESNTTFSTGFIRAIDTRSGRVRWTATTAGLSANWTPVPFLSGSVVVGSDNSGIFALSAQNGHEQWRRDWYYSRRSCDGGRVVSLTGHDAGSDG
ncbi:J domain-containing protein [Streptomyces chryseus]|nr:J domain-containing protein [Streptomyces chryseus]